MLTDGEISGIGANVNLANHTFRLAKSPRVAQEGLLILPEIVNVTLPGKCQLLRKLPFQR